MLIKSCFLIILLQFCTAKVQLPEQRQNTTIDVNSTPTKKSNTTNLAAKFKVQNVPQQAKRTIAKQAHQLVKTMKNASVAASPRQMNIENFVDSHKGAIVRLLKKLLLPKLKARALQHSVSQTRPLENDPANGNLDKEAMNYELGYFLGLQKAFKNRQMLIGDSGEHNLVPLKLTHRHGAPAAVSESGPMTGYTSVSMPFHKMKSAPVHENLQTWFTRYGMQDPGFLKKVTKADERDILQFAGKHNMDVFAERNNLKGITDYLSKRAYISKPGKVAETNEGASQRIKKDDILEPSIFAEEPDKPKEESEDSLARVESGPNPLEQVPTPLHKIVSQADHISSDEVHNLLRGTGGRVNWNEISGLIGDEEESKDRLRELGDKSPEVGSVSGEDTNVQAEEDRSYQQEVTPEELQNLDQGEDDHEVEKRTFNSLMRLAAKSEYDANKNELKDVLKRIISRLSEIPENREHSRLYDTPLYHKRGYVSSPLTPYYYKPVYTSLPRYPVQRLWRRNRIPRPALTARRANLPQKYEVSTLATKNEQETDDYNYKTENERPAEVEETGGVEAYALPKLAVNPATRIENYVATPKEESYKEAIALLNRGSSIDDSLGDNLQAGFLQRFVLPNSPTLYKRNSLRGFRSPMSLKYRLRLRRSNIDAKRKQNGKKTHKQSATSSKKSKKTAKMHRQRGDDEEKSKKAVGRETSSSGVSTKGSKKHEILREDSFPLMSNMDNFISPAVFESRSQNFFTQGGHDSNKLFSQFNGNTVLISGQQSGVGTAINRGYKRPNIHSGSPHQKQFPQNGKVLEQIISSPKMASLRTDSFASGQARSKFIGDRRVSPVLDIYKDHTVSATGDMPVMEVQNIKQNGVIQGKDEMQEVQNFNGPVQNEVETQGQGSIEMSSKYEVMKSPSAGAEMEAGGFQPINEDLVSQQNSQVMEEPKGDEQTGANAITMEEVSGETKQAISNTLAALDKQGAQSELESCCQVDPKSTCCEQKSYGLSPLDNHHHETFQLGGTSFSHSPAETPVYEIGTTSHPLSEHNLVQTIHKASQSLDEDLFAGAGSRHAMENKVVNHVYLPDEDFDGIDWRKLHQPLHGPVGYDAHSKEDIQLLSDPFFAPGVGEPIGDHSKPSIVPQSLLDHPANHFTPPTNASQPQTVVATPSVANAKTAPTAILKADAVNTAKALTAAGSLQVAPVTIPAAAPPPAPAAVPNATVTNEVVPNAAVRSAAVPNAAVRSAAVPNAAVPNAAVTNVAVPNAAVKSAAVPNAAVPSAAVPSATVPSAAVPNTAVPNTAVSSIAVPNTAVPNAAVPNANAVAQNAVNAAAVSLAANNTSKTAEEQLHAHYQAVHDLHKEITANAEHAAANVGSKMANDVKNATNAHYIADVKGAAVSKIKENHEHAAQLHQLANNISAGNNKVAAKAKELVNNAVVMANQDLHVPVAPKISNSTSDLAGHIYSSNDLIHSLQDPHSKTFDALEVEANKFADLHHDSLHMGTYLNQDAVHAMNPVSLSNLLSHDHVDADMHIPAVYGEWHTPGQNAAHDQNDAYQSHWNHVQLDSHPQVIDLSPMTPGGIHFTNTAGAEMTGMTGVGLPSATEIDATNTAAINSATSAAASANAAAANAGINAAMGAGVGAAVGTANVVAANPGAANGGAPAAAASAAKAAAANPNAVAANAPAAAAAAANTAADGGTPAASGGAPAAAAAAASAANSGANAATINAAAANAAKAAAANPNAVAANAPAAAAANTAADGGAPAADGGAPAAAVAAAAAAASAAKAAANSGANAATINAAAANAAKAAAGAELAAGKTDASNVGQVGGEMKKGSNAGSTAKVASASKDDIAENNAPAGYPDIDDSDGDKRNMPTSEESFDNDGTKKSDSKGNRKNKEIGKGKEDNETESEEGSGFDASTASTAEVEEGSHVNFEAANTDDFQMEKENHQGDSLDGKATMNFNQTNDTGPGEDESSKNVENASISNSNPSEEPKLDTDDKTTSLEVGNLKESKVQNFTESATAASEETGDATFVTNTDVKSRTSKEKKTSDERGSTDNENEGTGAEMEAGSENGGDGNGGDGNTKEENGASRSANQSSNRKPKVKTVEEGKNIESDEALRGNQTPSREKNMVRLSKAKKTKSVLKRKGFLHKIASTKASHRQNKKKVESGIARVHKPVMTKKLKQPNKISNTSEFFIGDHGNKKASFRQGKEKTTEFFVPKSLNTKVDDVKTKKRNSSEFFLIKTNNLTNVDPVSDEEIYSKGTRRTELFTNPIGKNDKELDDFQLSASARQHLLPGDLEKLSKLHRMLSMTQIDLLKKSEPEQENAITRMLRPMINKRGRASARESVKAEYRGAIHEALRQIEGVRRSLTNQQFDQETGKQPKNDQYRVAIHEALKEVDAVKKSLMQSTTSTKVLTNALAISNLANLLKESTNIFNKAYGVMHSNLPNSEIAANMVTGDLLAPGSSGVLINPAGNIQGNISPLAARKPTKDIYAEIGTPATNEDSSENSEKKTVKKKIVAKHLSKKQAEFRTIKEMK